MKHKIISIVLTAALLLTVTACTNTADTEIVTTDAAVTEPPINTATFASTITETEPQASEETTKPSETTADPGDKPAPGDSQYPVLMYKGDIYFFLVFSHQVEVDGKYYEVSGKPARFDAEKLRNECEYLGKSIPLDGRDLPTNELETIYCDEVYELYKIDENRILLYSSEPIEVVEEADSVTMYPGIYYLHYILFNENVSYEQMVELKAEYYQTTV